MTWLTRTKLLIAAAGLSIWGIGVRMGDERLKWAGIALLAVATLLRFVRDKEVRRGDGPGGGDTAEDEGRE